jgi:hypothetical protein
VILLAHLLTSFLLVLPLGQSHLGQPGQHEGQKALSSVTPTSSNVQPGRHSCMASCTSTTWYMVVSSGAAEAPNCRYFHQIEWKNAKPCHAEADIALAGCGAPLASRSDEPVIPGELQRGLRPVRSTGLDRVVLPRPPSSSLVVVRTEYIESTAPAACCVHASNSYPSRSLLRDRPCDCEPACVGANPGQSGRTIG